MEPKDRSKKDKRKPTTEPIDEKIRLHVTNVYDLTPLITLVLLSRLTSIRLPFASILPSSVYSRDSQKLSNDFITLYALLDGSKNKSCIANAKKTIKTIPKQKAHL